MAKLEVVHGGKSPLYICFWCKHEARQRETICPQCGQFDTLVRQEDTIEAQEPTREPKKASKLSTRRPQFLPTGSAAFDDVLGGGLVRKSSVLLYGTKGTGKTTRAIAIACHVARITGGKALYGSAEMPAEFVRMYAERNGIASRDLDRLWVQDSSDALDLFVNIDQIKPVIVVWDSIQRFSWEGEFGLTEARQVLCHAIDAARKLNHISLLLSQVNKGEDFWGSNQMGHDVDVVAELDRKGDTLTISCPHKNRFAETPRSACESFLGAPSDRPLEEASRNAPAPVAPPTIESDRATQEWFARTGQEGKGDSGSRA